MKYLLDTHTFIWFDSDAEKLSSHVREIIADPLHQKFISLVSVWEIQIKAHLGKLDLRDPLARIISDQLDNNSLELLLPTLEHVLTLDQLPHHHRDPFDRLLIAQAIAEDMTILTVDSKIALYRVSTDW